MIVCWRKFGLLSSTYGNVLSIPYVVHKGRMVVYLLPHPAHLAMFPEMKCNLNGELSSAIGDDVIVDGGALGLIGPGREKVTSC